ncbi:BON domain-containing protein [Streptomyces carminius]|uniref:BON domain-containing protein n=1 Tax=Streptomyces carminius TaxID=2665496 RepID=UPI001E638ED7|nr:BON domain-containing protein [Streptomyces carminius]
MMDRDARRTGSGAGEGSGAGAGNTEYRIAHLQERLVREEIAELGMRIESRGDAVVVTGTVPTAECRETVERVAREELAGVPVRTDIVVADATAPDRPEELA